MTWSDCARRSLHRNFYVSVPAAREAGRNCAANSTSSIRRLATRLTSWSLRTTLGVAVRWAGGSDNRFADCQVFVAAPEDVIIAKLWYYQEGGSEKHLRDIASMFRISGDQIDKQYITHWVDQLGVKNEWQAVLDRLAGA